MFGLAAKIQTSEKLYKTDHRDIEIQTEEFREQPKVFIQISLIYPVTLQELANDRGSLSVNWTLVPILDF